MKRYAAFPTAAVKDDQTAKISWLKQEPACVTEERDIKKKQVNPCERVFCQGCKMRHAFITGITNSSMSGACAACSRFTQADSKETVRQTGARGQAAKPMATTSRMIIFKTKVRTAHEPRRMTDQNGCDQGADLLQALFQHLCVRSWYLMDRA
jgi:hypothetical protein